MYIGKSINIKKRKREHFNRLRRNTHENSKLQRAFNKYGEVNFEFDVLVVDNFDNEELNSIEHMYIRLFDTLKNGYNLTYGGGGSVGWRASDEQKLIRSINSRGELNPFYGKKLSEEHKLKMKEASIKVKKTDAYRKRMSEVMKSRVFSDEHRKNKSLAQTGSKNHRSKRCIVNGVKYDCIKDVANEYNIPHNTASYRINSKNFKDWNYL